jgi:hypothetical protein
MCNVFGRNANPPTLTFLRAKKRGGLTRPHFFPIPCIPFHRPDESLPAMSVPLFLEGRVCPSTQPRY